MIAVMSLCYTAGCGGTTKDALPDLFSQVDLSDSVDLSVPVDQNSNPYGSCVPAKITGGSCATSEVGEHFTCSTWEHDLCCTCVTLTTGNGWYCLGPHVSQCAPAELCGAGPGKTVGGACTLGEVGTSFTCAANNGQDSKLCCHCRSSANGPTWECTRSTGTCAGDTDGGS